MNDDEKIRLFKIIKQHYDQRGMPLSADEFIQIYEATTGQTLKKKTSLQRLQELESLGNISAVFLFDGQIPCDAQNIVPKVDPPQKTKKTKFEMTKLIIWIGSFFGILGFAAIVSFPDYRDSAGVAAQLYPEIQGNLLKIDRTLTTVKRNQFDSVDFVKEAYDKHYRPFGVSKLDGTIGNFYNSMRMYKKYDQDSLKAMQNQGMEALKLLEDTFYLKAYGGTEKIGSIVSQDTSVAGVSARGYAKYTGVKVKEFISKK